LAAVRQGIPALQGRRQSGRRKFSFLPSLVRELVAEVIDHTFQEAQQHLPLACTENCHRFTPRLSAPCHLGKHREKPYQVRNVVVHAYTKPLAAEINRTAVYLGCK
jgi:hypothetical protein